MDLFSLILDLAVVGLLVATITYAVILNRKLGQLRNNRQELEALIKGLNEAVARADTGIKGMKRTAAETGEALQKAITRAKELRDELQIVIETGDALASRIERAVGRVPSAEDRMAGTPVRPARRERPRAGSDGDGPGVERDWRAVDRSSGRARSRSDDTALPFSADDQADAEAADAARALIRAAGGRGPPPRREGALNDPVETGDPAAKRRTRGRPSTATGSANGVDGTEDTSAIDDVDGLSRAERELLKAIESRR